MNRLIFITSPSNCGYRLVQLAKKKRGAKTTRSSSLFRAGNTEVIVIDEQSQNQKNMLGVKKMASIINAHAAKNKGSECYCAIHGETRMEELKSLLKTQNIAHLQHTPGELLYDQILGLLEHDQAVPERLDAICSLINKKPIVSRVVGIKHKIGHFLLPLDINIQGLIESGNSGQGALVYFKDIKQSLLDGVTACANIEKILQAENGYSINTKEMNKVVKSGESLLKKMSQISATIDTKRASNNTHKRLMNFIGFIKKDAKSGSNKFHEWFRDLMAAVDKYYCN